MAAIAYINLADSATITASSSAPLMPASRLQYPHVSRKWRGVNGTGEALIVDLGSAQSIDTVALIGLNLTLAGQARVRVSSSDATGVAGNLYDNGAGVTGLVDPAYGYLVVLLPSPVTGRYVRIDVLDSSLSYVEAGRLYIGKRFTTTYNFAPGWQDGRVDTSRKTVSRGGQTYIDVNVSYRTVDISFEWLTLAERNSSVAEIDRLNGEHTDILLIRDTASTNMGRDCLWGLVDGNQPIVQPYAANVFSKSYRLRERL